MLPFVNMSGDAANEYFSDGMTEELISTLSRVAGLRVAARTSAFGIKGKSVDMREIGRKLDVVTVLEGSVRQTGSRLRVAARLVRASDGDQLWSEEYDRELRDVFAVQEDIARAITAALRLRLVRAQVSRPRPFGVLCLHRAPARAWAWRAKRQVGSSDGRPCARGLNERGETDRAGDRERGRV